MHKLNKVSFSLALLVAVVVVGSAPAFARGLNSGSSDSGTSSSKVEPEVIDQPGVHEAGEVSSETELHHRGNSIVADMKKQEGKPKTTEQRQKVCEAHKQGLSNKFSHLVTNSQKIQTKIDGIYAKALAFQQSSGATPTGFADLVATADTAKANAAASIANLQTITPTIDCNSTSVASDVATFKAAAQQTRDNLKAYKTAVKAVLKALQTTKTSTEGSTN